MAPVDLGAGERIVWTGHTHAKVLLWPAAAFLVLAAATGAGMGLLPTLPQVPQRWAGPVLWAAFGLGAALVVVFCGVPFARWFTTVYAVTDRRVAIRRGVISRETHSLPLGRVHDVEVAQSALDRVLRCGTIRLTTAADQPLALHDVPHVRHVHRLVHDLLFAADAARPEDTAVLDPP
ncbi:MAG: PH domain-containing protein [Propionibacteriaceae bacterium]|jgi:uncharacterized membrane protein YdbT with pleckstrin-like domain|nr:PH domain-containing protein [Propionibacteriaceae bacterium]